MKLRSAHLIILATAVGFFTLGRQWERQAIKIFWDKPFPQVEIQNRDLGQPGSVDFALFWRVWQLLGRSYFDQTALDPQKMVFGAIEGMVRAVGDPYTAFLVPEVNERVREQIEGSFEGVGIQIGFRDDVLAVIAPLKGTPAERAGIRAGDKVLTIDGQTTAGISLPEAQAKIRGPKGTKVDLTILHHGEKQPIEIAITRGVILIKSLEWEDQGGIAVIRLRRFSENTPKEWDRLVREIISQGKPRGVVLDLRDNPGGLLTGAVHVASEFIADGVITTQQKADGSSQTFRTNRPGRLIGVPVAVLINKGSASASEILAGALQQSAKAALIGEQSFGKGTIQEVEDLPFKTSLHLTTGQWLLPNGGNLDEIGLRPDFEVQDATETADLDEVLEHALGTFL